MKPVSTLKMIYQDCNGVQCEIERELERVEDERELAAQILGPSEFLLIPTSGSYAKLGFKLVPKDCIMRLETIPKDANTKVESTEIRFPSPYGGQEKIKAIKMIREVTHLGLKDAKSCADNGGSGWYPITTTQYLSKLSDLGVKYELR